jgi:hypothetical protein
MKHTENRLNFKHERGRLLTKSKPYIGLCKASTTPETAYANLIQQLQKKYNPKVTVVEFVHEILKHAGKPKR